MRKITKCHGDGCLKRDSCYRYTSPAGYYQAWMAPNATGEKCTFFWSIESLEYDAKRLVGAGER